MVHTATSEQVEALKGLDSPAIANAIETFRVRERTIGYTGTDVRCQFPHLGTMVGHAVTVLMDSTSAGHSPPTAEQAYELWELVEKSPKPVVLVFQHVDHDIDRSCCFGEFNATIAQKLGAVGLVTNGGVRDLKDVEALSFHYFARGTVPSHGNYHYVKIGKGVTVSGMEVSPGDLLVGDVNGVVSIPGEIALDDLVERARQVTKRETMDRAFAMTSDFTLKHLREQKAPRLREAIRRRAQQLAEEHHR